MDTDKRASKASDRGFQQWLGMDHLISGGGGWDFSLRQVIFFCLFAQQVTFSKVNSNKFFIFFSKITQ